MALCVALPVPVFAASGLALPLPGVVYRLAVAAAAQTETVAFHASALEADSGNASAARVGAIRLTDDERQSANAVAAALRTFEPRVTRSVAAAGPGPVPGVEGAHVAFAGADVNETVEAVTAAAPGAISAPQPAPVHQTAGLDNVDEPKGEHGNSKDEKRNGKAQGDKKRATDAKQAEAQAKQAEKAAEAQAKEAEKAAKEAEKAAKEQAKEAEKAAKEAEKAAKEAEKAAKEQAKEAEKAAKEAEKAAKEQASETSGETG